MRFEETTNGYVYKDEKGHLLAEITYVIEDKNTIIADHTYVSPTLRGQGIAKKLVDTLADKARREQKKIHPTCPYIVKLFQETDEYDDIKI